MTPLTTLLCTAAVLAFVLCLCIITTEANDPSCHWKKRQATTSAGAVAALTFEFDWAEEVYLLESKDDCPSFTCQEEDPPGSPSAGCWCDYSQKGDRCGSPVGGDCLCPERDWCSDEGEWERLLLGETHHGVLTHQETKFYRFVVPNKCATVKVSLLARSGWPEFSITRTPSPSSAWRLDKPFQNTFFLCPSNIASLQVGTWFVAVRNKEMGPAEYTFSVEEIDPPRPRLEACPTPVFPSTWNKLWPGCTRVLSNGAGLLRTLEYEVPREHLGCPTFFSLSVFDGGNPVFAWISYKQDSPDVGPYNSKLPYTSPPWNAEEAFLLYDDHRVALSFCPEQTENVTVYITLWTRFMTTSMSVTAESDPTRFRTIPTSDLQSFSGLGKLLGSSHLSCPQQNYYCYQSYVDRGEEGRYGVCTAWNIRVPHEHGWLWPLPSILWKENPSHRSLKFVESETLAGQYSAMITLNYTNLSTGTQWQTVTLSEEEALRDCSVSFAASGLSRLVKASGGPLDVLSVPLSSCEEKALKCDHSRFQLLSNEVTSILDQMKRSTSSDEMETLRFRLDTVAFSDDWLACSSFAESLLSTGSNQVFRSQNCTLPNYIEAFDNHLAFYQPNNSDVVHFTEVRDQLLSDPCCYEGQAWFQCCQESQRQVTVDLFFAPSPEQIAGTCHHPECARSFLEDYASELASDSEASFDSCDSIMRFFPDRATFTTASFDFWRNCTAYAFGEDLQGFPCSHASDCPGSVACTNGHCLISAEIALNRFLSCFLDTVSPFVLYHLRDLRGLPDQVTTDHLKVAYATLDCEPPAEAQTLWPLIEGDSEPLALRNRWHYQQSTMFEESCEDDCTEEFACLSQRCRLPPVCSYTQAFGAGACPREWTFVAADSEACIEQGFCNWDAQRTTNESCMEGFVQSESFCAACVNGQSGCVTLGFNATQCNAWSSESEEERVCVFGNGQWKTVESAEDCFWCDEYCWDNSTGQSRECQDQAECEATSGRCLDEQVFQDHSGVCINTNLPPYFSSACSSTIPVGLRNAAQVELRYTPYGCIVEPASGGSLSSSQCLSSFEEYGYQYLARQHSAETCLQIGHVCEEVSNTYALFNRGPPLGESNKILTGKNEEECNCGNGNYRPWFVWKAGKWREGNIIQPVWREKKFISNTWTTSFDYSALEQDISDAARLLYSLQQQTESRCKYSKRLRALKAITCDCTDNGTDEEQCFGEEEAPNAISRVCQGIEQVVPSPPHSVRVAVDSVEKAGHCVDLETFDVSASVFRKVPKRKLSSAFTHFERDVQEWNSVFNQKGGIVGRLVGDGMKIVWKNALIRHFTLCFELRKDILLSTDEKFAEPDLGIVRDGKVLALGLRQVNHTGNELCATVQAASLERTFNGTYYPLFRISDWEDEDDSFSLSSGEKAVLYFAAISYLVLLGVAIFSSILFFYVHRDSIAFIHATPIFLIMFACLRSIYFFVLAAEIDLDDTLSFFLAEIPILLFFAALTVVITTLAVILARARCARTNILRLIKLMWGAANLVLLGVLIFFVILYETLPLNTETTCGGREEDNLEDTQPRDVVNIVYKVLLAAIALTIGALFLIFGGRIYHRLRVLKKKAKRRGERRGTKLFVVSLGASICFLLQSILLLTLALADWRNVVFGALILLVVEVVPSLTILFLLAVPRKGQHSSDSDKSSKSTSGSEPTRTSSGVNLATTSTDSQTDSADTNSSV